MSGPRRYRVGDIVEDTTQGDLPFIVLAVEREPIGVIPGRYTIESIEGVSIKNFPGYLLTPARPASESKYGPGKTARVIR